MTQEHRITMFSPLTPEHIKSFLAKYKNPADARKFLLEAGLIDESGNLAPPYRISLSPPAAAIYEAYCTEADRLNREVNDREMIAAALRAAADQAHPKAHIEDIDYVHQSYVDGWKDALAVLQEIADALEAQ